MNVMMKNCDSDKILFYLNSSSIRNFLEIGSGGSTLYFSKHVQNYYSIEHDKSWFEMVKKEIEKDQRSNIKIVLKEKNKIDPNIDQKKAVNWSELTSSTRSLEFKDYIDSIGEFGVTFDAVLVDGRARPECVRYLHDNKLITKNGIIFIHDYRPVSDPRSRKHYNVVEEKYTIIDHENKGSGLAVLKINEKGENK